jgi:hypothetical protein
MPPRSSSRRRRRTRCFPTRRNAANMTVRTAAGSGEFALILASRGAVLGASPRRFFRVGSRRRGRLWASRKSRHVGLQTLRPSCGWSRKKRPEAARWKSASPSASHVLPAKDAGTPGADRAHSAGDKGQSGSPGFCNCGSRQGSVTESCFASRATARRLAPMPLAAIFTSGFACGLVGKSVPAAGHTP